MPAKARFGVKFIGYTAYLGARKYHREIDYAELSFLTGTASILADGGWVKVRNRADLGPLMKILPDLANELRERLREGAAQVPQESVGSSMTRTADDLIKLSHGQSEVCVLPGTDVNRFIRQIIKHFTEIEQGLEEVEQIGSRIKRRPYSEYVDEIERTGLVRVEVHGFGLFLHGRLIFQPDYQVGFAKPITSDIFEVHLLESANVKGLQQN
jgi:hypothetical protein